MLRAFTSKEASMKHRFAFILLSGLLLCGVSVAQSSPSANSQAQQPSAAPQGTPGTTPSATSTAPNPNRARIAPGSVIPALLTKTVDAKKAKTGDEVTAKVTQDMKSTSGELLVPKDTEIIGHVTEAQPRNKEQKESDLGIAFDHAVMSGQQMQLPMSIQAVVAPPSNSPGNAGANDQSAPTAGGGAPSAPSGGQGSMGGGSRAGAPGSSTPSQQANYPPSGDQNGEQAQNQTGARPQINGQTQGVVGISNMKLETTAQNPAQGSVLRSEKNNVKIEKGTLMLLRVNQ